MVQPLRKPDEFVPADQAGQAGDEDGPHEPELVLLTQPPVEDFDWTTLGSGEAATKLLPEELARKYLSFPARVIDGKLLLVMADPQDYRAIQTLELRAGLDIVGDGRRIRRPLRCP
jgi:hypothetical protein